MTKIGTMPEQGDIVLISIPFTDLSAQKRRPVIVVSNDDYNRQGLDIVVVAMTSNPIAGRYTFTISSSNLESGKLNRPGQVRVDKLYTLSQSIAVKTFGRVDVATLDYIRGLLRNLVAKSLNFANKAPANVVQKERDELTAP